MTNCVNFTLHNLLASYKKWIVANPHLLSDIEATVRCLSYFSFGQLRNSSLSVELIYSMPNLIVLCNDLLMYSSKCKDLKVPQFESKIKIWLTVVEYTEALLEVSAEKLWGAKGKWLIIVIIQLFKTILRLLSIHVYKERMTKSPATPPLNREKFNKVVDSIQSKEGFTLKRSGTVIRSIKHSVPIEMRTWKALPSNTDENKNLTKNQESEKILKLAESFYVTKPLLHLGCMYITNKNQWPPWMLSFIIDVVSLNIFTRCAPKALFNKEEEEELVRRRLSLLLYILRSPFYDKYSCVKINALLDALSTSVPFAKLLTNAVKKNLPYMQTAIVNNGQCLCYPGTTCPPGCSIDIRIVNTGTTCPSGQIYCCTTPTNNVGCGIRKIPSTPHPPGQAAYGAYPWQVAILTVGNVYLGGGVLVSPMYVLTAAHKVQNYENNPGGIKAKLGAWDSQSTTEPSVDISISKVTLHPQYNSNCNLDCPKQNLPYDIAVLRLSSAAPIATSPNINTACLPNGPVGAGTKCWVTGWGKNAFGPTGMYQNILREVDVPVLTHEACQTDLRSKTRLGGNFNLDSNSMCAGGEAGKDACTGDGGSPLVCPTQNGAFEVIGLVIWGIGCADAGVPGVYTNVYNYISWIRQQMT